MTKVNGSTNGLKLGEEPNSEEKDVVGFEDLKYQNGFGNHFSGEALKGALPVGQNSPLKCPYGLYAEQVSGTAFTVPRKLNQRRYTKFSTNDPLRTHNSGYFELNCDRAKAMFESSGWSDSLVHFTTPNS